MLICTKSTVNMRPKRPQLLCSYHLPTITIFFLLCSQSQSQPQPLNPPVTEGFTCDPNRSANYPCQAYALYRPTPPNFLDLASVGDLFSLSRLMIAKPSNISDPTAPLNPAQQQLFVPLTCSCNTVNSTFSISSANLNYTIKSGDTFWYVSTDHFQNLTTYQSVEAVNPGVVPTKLEVGDNVVFPIFCQCPDQTQKSNRVNFMVSYVFQPSDDLSRVAATFRVSRKSIDDANGNRISPLNTIFIPVNRLPVLAQGNSSTNSTPPPTPNPTPPTSSVKTERKGLIRGLAAGIGICGVLLVMVIGFCVYREKGLKKEVAGKWQDEERQRKEFYMAGGGGKGIKEMEASLMADVSECLDKYRVFKIDELREATDGFSEDSLIEGSVFKGRIDGVQYAIKKMKWNAREELKILQKVNHGNLVQLEGFCIDAQEANCYLVYEYIENGSLHSWLHTDKSRELSWKSRVRIAIDVANGLQYIHEHTRPRVVHKDVKSTNILLDSNMRAKIANFGLAKSGCNAITMHIVGTQGYIAPEYLADGVVSTKMDVFAFGVILLELVSGKEAIDEDGNVLWGEVGLVVMEGGGGSPEGRKMEKVRSWVDEALVEETYSIDSVVNIITVAAACVHRDPAKRPSMVDVVYALCRSDELFFDVSNEGLSNPTVIAR